MFLVLDPTKAKLRGVCEVHNQPRGRFSEKANCNMWCNYSGILGEYSRALAKCTNILGKNTGFFLTNTADFREIKLNNGQTG